MRRPRTPLIIAVSLSLLSLQSSGVHMHVGDSGYVGAPETPFTHSHGHRDQHEAHHVDPTSTDHADHGGAGHTDDYDDVRDVSLVDLALGTFKMPFAILLVLLFSVVPLVRTTTCAEVFYRVLSGRHTRWRPPLRAPPQPA